MILANRRMLLVQECSQIILIYLHLQYSLPDSLGDDLILEVHDSKGKYCGRVVAQVAAIAEDPVWSLSLVSLINCQG